jgi:hypothetical protein
MHALYKAWQRSPPVHKLLAAFVGYESPEERKAQYMTGEMAEAIIKGGGVLISADMIGGMQMPPPGRR